MMIRDSQQTTTLTHTRTPRNPTPHKATLDTSPALTRTRDTTTQDTLQLHHHKSSNQRARNYNNSREYPPESPGSTRLSAEGSSATEYTSLLDLQVLARLSSRHSFSTTGYQSTTRTGSTLCWRKLLSSSGK